MLINALQLLTRMASTYNIPTKRVKPPFEGLEDFDYGLRNALDPAFDWQEFGHTLLKCTPPNTLLFAEGTFELRFALFRVPDETDTVFLIGPWVKGPRSEETRRWVLHHIGEEGDHAIEEYYNGVSVLPDDSFMVAVYNVVSLMMGIDNLPTQELKEFLPFMFTPNTRYFTEPEFERDIPVSMLEQRYTAENKLLDAVAHGDETSALVLSKQMESFSLGRRFTGSLYREKTRLIILNTLLRKALERSDIHPFYIDKISSSYAQRIEALTDASGNDISRQMLRDYCAYVRRYSLKGYSPAVQTVINHINLNVGDAHTLKSLAAICHISPSYLSALFKQETGTTLIDYINTQRVKRAAHLLASTNRSVADISEEMGILDVNYFAKVFKRTYGVTPTRYRREHKNA